MQEYLKSTYLCPVNDKTRGKAEEIVSDPKDKESAAQELFSWVRDTYCWDMRKIRGAGYLLHKQPTKAMSFSKSTALIALLRSIDIPARYNQITCKMKNEYKDTVEDSVHAPAEVHLGGEWITADPTYGSHTSQYKSVSSFGEETWEEVENSEKKASLSRGFVMLYNYLLRFVHPDIRQIRRELRECQNL